jgi:glycine/D-amino acid oxidase-like deaminating enzyme
MVSTSLWRGARARSSSAGAEVRGLRSEGGGWTIETSAGDFEGRRLADAAGAWADRVAAMAGAAPIGLQPYRRTLVQLRVDPPVPAGLPLIIDALGRFYFKPEAGGRLWLSPHDETPCDPCDCAPEELDVAVAIDRLERTVDWRVERVERSWAGLRSFAPDRLPGLRLRPARPGLLLVRRPGRLRHPDRPRRGEAGGGPAARPGARVRSLALRPRAAQKSWVKISTIPASDTAQAAVRSQGTPAT